MVETEILKIVEVRLKPGTNHIKVVYMILKQESLLLIIGVQI